MSRIENEKSDEELMVLYQSGSSEAFDILFQRYSAKIHAYLRKRLGARSEIDDIFQEVFLKLHRSKHLYQPSLPVSPWVYTVARSVMLDFLKKKNLEDVVSPEGFDSFAAPAPESESQIDFERQLSQLPISQSEVVKMRVYDDKTFEEIAEKLATSPENARQLLSRAVKSLRVAIVGKGSK